MSEPMICPFCAGSIEAGARECPACHHSLENTNPRGALALGAVLAGRYTIGEFVYADGEGICYRGVENKGGIPVTIKEYLPVTLAADRGADGALRPKAGSEVLFKTTRMDFADLYRALMRITPATGLEAVLDVVELNDTVYAVLENPGGIPINQYLDTVGGTMAPAEARSMLQPVFEGVAAMHAAGLVHRGISPENIRVLENGKARLTGYATIGLRTAGSGLRAQLYEGYSAPEQYSTAEFEGRYTDEYALAAVFYRMVCGRAPVSAGQRLVADSNPAARTLEPAVPGYLSQVLEVGLRLKPAERIQTVPELMSALASPDAARPLLNKAGALRQEEKALRSKGAAVGMLAGVLVLLTVMVLLALWMVVGRPGSTAGDSEPASSAAPTAEPESVPNFVGFTYAQLIANQNYSSKYLFYHNPARDEYSTEYDEGVVIRQSPEPGEAIGADYTVELILSKGPELAVMPNIIGWQQEDAVSELRKARLTSAVYVMENDGTYASGCVVKCSAEPGEELPTGTTVTVYIAADRDVIIPPTPTPSVEPSPTPTSVPEEVLD